MKLKRSHTTLVIVLLGIVIFIFFKTSYKPQNYTLIPVSFFPFIDRPTIKIEIEKKYYSLLVDIGSSHPIDLNKKSMQKIKNKNLIGTSNYVGIRGKKYPTQSFYLPRLKLLNLTIDNLIGFEESIDFHRDAKIGHSSSLFHQIEDHVESLLIDGRIGWTFFNKGVVFFDFPCSRLVIAKDLLSMTNKAEFNLINFTQIPFEIKNCGLVISIKTNLGVRKFLLDTGATCSVLRKSRFAQELENIEFVSEKLKIGQNDFGDWSFKPLEYNKDMECDGILGVDFFKKHSICLDFLSNTAYVKRTIF